MKHPWRKVTKQFAKLNKNTARQVAKFRSRFDGEKSRISRLQEGIERRNRTIAVLERRVAARDEKIASLRNGAERNLELIERLRRHAEYYRENTPTNRFLRLARQAHAIADRLRAEVYVGHGVQALPAADMVARAVGGRLMCDVIEIPAFASRGETTWHATNLAFLDLAFESYLCRCDAMTTIGWALKGQIEHFGPPVNVIPNYRYAEDLRHSDRLREWCGLDPDAELVLAISSIKTGFEAVVAALARLPDRVHLAVVGRLVPASYEQEMIALIGELGLTDRVHLFPQVPYQELTGTASGADVGLIIRNPDILNNKISLPNRIFDYMFAGLPVCCPEIPDIARILQQRGMGAVVGELTAAGWAEAISSVLEAKEEMSRNALAASKEMVWEKVEDTLYDALGRPGSVTYLGYNDLTKNNRTMRMATTLAERGVDVTICTYCDGPARQLGDRIRLEPLEPY